MSSPSLHRHAWGARWGMACFGHCGACYRETILGEPAPTSATPERLECPTAPAGHGFLAPYFFLSLDLSQSEILPILLDQPESHPTPPLAPTALSRLLPPPLAPTRPGDSSWCQVLKSGGCLPSRTLGSLMAYSTGEPRAGFPVGAVGTQRWTEFSGVAPWPPPSPRSPHLPASGIPACGGSPAPGSAGRSLAPSRLRKLGAWS